LDIEEDDDESANSFEGFAAGFMASRIPAGAFETEAGLCFGGSFRSGDVQSRLGSLPQTAFSA
jgi:hypothetical protein